MINLLSQATRSEPIDLMTGGPISMSYLAPRAHPLLFAMSVMRRWPSVVGVPWTWMTAPGPPSAVSPCHLLTSVVCQEYGAPSPPEMVSVTSYGRPTIALSRRPTPSLSNWSIGVGVTDGSVHALD